MKNLHDIVGDKDTLAQGLKELGSSHINYKTYSSMNNSLEILENGYIYLSTGQKWNDIQDRELMARRKVFAKSFSYSTRENIAMWMLYGGSGGKTGAMINFPNSVLQEILETKTVEIGISENHEFLCKYVLEKQRKDYEIFISDVVYTDDCKGNKIKLTLYEKHKTVNKNILENTDIFYKNYAWAYERESRLIVRIINEIIKAQKELNCLRIQLSDNAITKLKTRIYQSPVHDGDCKNVLQSSLKSKVFWKIT